MSGLPVEHGAGWPQCLAMVQRTNLDFHSLPALLEAAPEPTAVVDPAGAIAFANRRWTSWIGAVAEEAGGWCAVLGGPRWETISAGLAAVGAGQRESFVHAIAARESVPHELRAWPLHSSGGLVVVQLRPVAGAAAVAVKDAELAALRREIADLRDAAERDPLTGLYNRRGLEHRLAHEQRQLVRAGTSAAALLIDCDDFKHVNAVLGHAGGDDVLRAIADTLRWELRPRDFGGRVGGDEFLVVLPDTALEQGRLVALRLAMRMSEAGREVRGGQALTVSIGIARLEAGTTAGVDRALRATQHALRTAKHDGKNRIAGAPAAEAS